jgi:nucleotide-binding universal stress UspA family protein
MRVNLFNLRQGSVEAILILLVFAGAAKMLFGFAGARLGRLPAWEAATVGVGLTLKGGTDVVVAIVGTELMLLSSDLYTTYAVVAILTVIATPPLLNWLASKTRPGTEELKRLNREEARKLAYLADRERVLVPLEPELMPALAARIVATIAAAKRLEGELFDVTEVALQTEPSTRATAPAETPEHASVVEASSALAEASTLEMVEVERIASSPEQVLETLEAAAASQHLLVMGAAHASGELSLSFGALQDRIVREVSTDVLIAVHRDANFPEPRRILVPVTALAHSYAAADIAAYIAKGANAEVVLLAVMAPRLGPLFWRARKHRDLLQAGYTITREARLRMSHLDVPVREAVVLSATPVEAIAAELKRGGYDLLVLGSVLRSSPEGISLGSTVEHLLQVVDLPRLLLVSRNVEVSTQ